MGSNWFSVLSACLLGASLSVASSSAKDIPFKFECSGTTIAATLDINNDGDTGNAVTCDGRSNLGPITIRGYTEDMDLTPSGACAAGELEQSLVARRDVVRFITGDLLYAAFTSQTICINPSTGAVKVAGAGQFVGGTGRFAGATGKFEVTATGQLLLLDSNDPNDGKFFSAIAGKLRGTIGLK